MKNYRHTIRASYLGCVTQAAVNNLAPLLFLTFQNSYGVSLEQIGFLITINFGVQLIVDLVAAKFIDRIGYRIPIVAAHILCAVGLMGLGILPGLFSSPYLGLLVSIVLYAVGGGLIEVLISPIVEACPTENKSSEMSLLHSFYCWGHVAVVLGSTVFFAVAGRERWRFLCLLWALIPAWNGAVFARVPVRSLKEERGQESWRRWLKRPAFWLFALVMMCSGATEQAMSQWVSAFAETGLGVSKTVGDLAGPCLFAALMGASRLFYAGFSRRIPLKAFMAVSGGMCLVCFGAAVFCSSPVWALLGCALCGLWVGILWPGTFSLAAGELPGGGTAMFAFLALAGDLGCSAGPGVVGMAAGISGAVREGLLTALVFPVFLAVGTGAVYLTGKNHQKY